MAPAKTYEVRFTGCLLSEAHFYRLAVDHHETELLSTSTTVPKFHKLLHVQLSDGVTAMELSIAALIDGAEKVVAIAQVPIVPSKDFTHYDVVIPTAAGNTVTGTVKLAYKLIKLNVIGILRETVNNRSVLGISVNTGLVGESADAAAEYKDIRLKIKDKEGTVLGNNKVSNDKSAVFFPLEDHEVFGNEASLELIVTMEDGDKTFPLALQYGTMSVSVPMSSTLAILVTCQVLYEPSRQAGLVHEISMAVLKQSGPNDKVSSLKGNDYITLTRKNLLYLQFINAEGNVDVVVPEESLLKAIKGVPFERAELQPMPDGLFIISTEAHSGRSLKKKPLMKKNLVIHLGTFGISSSLVASPDMLVRAKCTMVGLNTDIQGSVDGSLSCNTKYNTLMGSGILEEKERETSKEMGIISVVLEGKVDIRPTENPLMNALSKSDSYLSARVTISIVPTESPPLISPTGELMPLSPPDSPRIEEHHDEQTIARAPSKKSLDGLQASSSVPKLDIGQISRTPSQQVLQPVPSNEQFMAMDHPNVEGEMPGQWNLQAQGQDRSLYGGEDMENWGSPGALGDNFSPTKYKIDRASTALVSMIKSELVEKQRLIDRLINEASARTDAIELCGREIRSLREEILSLQTKARDAESALAQRDADIAEASKYVEDAVGSPEQLARLSRNTLIHIACDLGERNQKLILEKEELEELVAEAHASRMQFEEDKKTLSELQDAHVEQSRLIQKLQKKLSATDSYKSTIKLQERVIAKMQAVIEAHLRTTRQEGGPEAAGMLDRILQDLERKGQEEEQTMAQAQAEEYERTRRRAAEEELKKEKHEANALRKQVGAGLILIISSSSSNGLILTHANSSHILSRTKVKQLEADLKKATDVKSVEPSSLSELDANRKIDQLDAEVSHANSSSVLSRQTIIPSCI